jgi:hypothetical protein
MLDRDGDLYLTSVARVVNGLPEPASGWRAAITYILDRPDVFGPVRSITDRMIADRNSDALVGLPADVYFRLGLPEAPAPGVGGWVRGELVRPVIPQPVAHPDTSATYGVPGGAPTAPAGGGSPAGSTDLPETVNTLLGIARRLPRGSSEPTDAQHQLRNFLTARFVEIRHRGQPETEGMAVAQWFDDATNNTTAGAIQPRTWRHLETALEVAGDNGFVIVLPDNTHPASVLTLDKDSQIWHIAFTPDGPVPGPLTTSQTPPQRIMIFNKCSEYLLLPSLTG